MNQDWHYLYCACSHFWMHIAQVPDCPHSFFSERFFRLLFGFLVLILIFCYNPKHDISLNVVTLQVTGSRTNGLGLKFSNFRFQGELQQIGTCRLTFGSAQVMLSMFSKVQIDISLGTTISKPHKEKKYFWALPESVPSPKFSNWALISNVFLIWSPTITMSFVTFDIDWQLLYQSDSSNVS